MKPLEVGQRYGFPESGYTTKKAKSALVSTSAVSRPLPPAPLKKTNVNIVLSRTQLVTFKLGIVNYYQ